jgi:hypothetical protein
MSKDKAKTEIKPDTASALEIAEQAQRKAQAALDAAEHIFETEQSERSWQSVIALRGELELRSRLLGFAQNAHDAALRAEQERIAAEAERIRLEALAKVEAATNENLRLASDACATIAKAYAASWDLAIKAQGLGGAGLNSYNSHVSAALFDAMIAAGNAPSALRFV